MATQQDIFVGGFENYHLMLSKDDRIQWFSGCFITKGNQIVTNPQGYVATLVVRNNGNMHNTNQIRCYNCRGLGHHARNCTNKTRDIDLNYYTKRLMLVQQEETGVPLTAKQHNCIFMTKLQPASPNMDSTHVYDTDGLPKVPNFDNIYNMFAHEEQHSELPKSSQDHVRNYAARLQDLIEQSFASSPLADHDKHSNEVEFVPHTQGKSNDRAESSHKHVIKRKDVNSNPCVLPSTGVKSTTRSRGPKSKDDTKNDRVSFASKSSCLKNKVEVEEHCRNLPSFAITKHVSCYDNVSNIAYIKKLKATKIEKYPKEVRIATPSVSPPRHQKPRNCLKWRPTGRIFPIDDLLDTNLGCSKHMTENLKLLINFIWKFMGTGRFRNDHVAAIQGYDNLQWGNILITRVYYVDGS
uniref:Integrase, catalytic region, zinc finger, CCHC-type, peptidase aspartic, catalytic n=1 Tax=Tanacetum cinerariifolium TaxID=118510 RepID=A0A6L2K0R1_TANCI|nr:integrase, catalytic region, zinc finger, CCHC-type, peptidase aspartic, catalytic [Tanacetum cinerariifolium]